jgi:tetratricopeptide (TPR) repeat protein
MSRLDQSAFSELLHKATEAHDSHKFKPAVRYARLAGDVAKRNGNVPDQMRAAFVEGNALIKQGEYRSALPKFTWILSESERNPAAVTDEVNFIVLQSFGDWARTAASIPGLKDINLLQLYDAGEKYLRATGQDRERADLLHSKSIVLWQLDDLRQALLTAEEALALKRRSPVRSTGQCTLGHFVDVYATLLMTQGKPDEALELVNEEIERAPSAGYYGTRGNIHFRIGNFEQGIRDYTVAINECPDASSYKMRGILHALNGSVEYAVRDFKASLRLNGDDAYVALWLAGVDRDLTYLPKFKTSSEFVGKIVRHYLGEISSQELVDGAAGAQKQLCEAYTNLGLIADSLNRLDEARRYYELSVGTNATTENEFSWAKARLARIQEKPSAE